MSRLWERYYKKPIDTEKGLGIQFWKREEGIERLKEIVRFAGENLNAQEYITQHPNLAKMNPNSCNIIRVMTYANKDGVRVIKTYYQVGMSEKSRMSQVSIGGVCVSILPDGTLAKTAYDEANNSYEVHASGIRFEGYKIVGYEVVCQAAIKLHRKMGHFGIISWDFTVGENEEPIFIEMNVNHGGIMFHQMSGGPLFGEQTDEILTEVMLKRK